MLPKPGPRNRHDRMPLIVLWRTKEDDHVQLGGVPEPRLDALLALAESPLNLLGLRPAHFALPNESRLSCGALVKE